MLLFEKQSDSTARLWKAEGSFFSNFDKIFKPSILTLMHNFIYKSLPNYDGSYPLIDLSLFAVVGQLRFGGQTYPEYFYVFRIKFRSRGARNKLLCRRMYIRMNFGRIKSLQAQPIYKQTLLLKFQHVQPSLSGILYHLEDSLGIFFEVLPVAIHTHWYHRLYIPKLLPK